MNSVVIGGTGFIGSALVRALVAQGDNVVSISRSGGTDAPHLRHVAIDLADQPCPDDVLAPADMVYVLIGQVHKNLDTDQEQKIIERLAQQLASCRARVVYFSTVHVYGHTPEPATEATPVDPVDEYGAYKVKAERILSHYIAPDRLTILRMTNIYGAPQNQGFIGFLMRAVQSDTPTISLNGNGMQRRDYLFLDDFVTIVTETIRERTDLFGVVNVATGTVYTLEEVVKLVEDVSGKSIPYAIRHNQVNEPQDSLIDTTKLRTEYGVTQFTPLTEGLTQTLARFQAQE